MRKLRHREGGLSVGDFRKVLMKTGLVLVVLGHVSFIAAALLHGTVLRYVAAPNDAVALHYSVVNILSVTSAIVVITSGIAVIVLSRYLPSIPLRWTVFSSSVACALLSLTCALGLLASIAVTFATQGHALLAACTFGDPELLALAPDCPFDPTRIYRPDHPPVAGTEALVGEEQPSHDHPSPRLLPLSGCPGGEDPDPVGWQPLTSPQMRESPEPVEDHDLQSCTSSGLMTL
ncbi:transmembrane protein 54 isoform X2 [Tursiops truncatus]|uniref:Transmembrane protein 54 isoform X2 n=1 Tax=Tursiops truncatus TaxID=9739 RepID=A0A6J3PWV2_TURTR|nr:transmembrane protein 54 isoform X2 [Tursiops truncatus]XP_033694458.1 transmembrane protein 54 isoform X2 [Tursiops truncatus]